MSIDSKNSDAQNRMANAIRALSMDAVQAAKSGHPGMPMGMADVSTVLFRDFLKFDPEAPDWADRDRFVLSAGHGSMLLYSLLHLTGYEDMTLDRIRNFRQLGSITTGHPEYGRAGGIETTTGPLGQGIATAVGMALAERMLNARFGDGIIDHRTYVIASDGDLMEGVSHEAISLAGHWKLGKLIVLFDDNQISIDGPTKLSVTGDQMARFEAAGWNVTEVDGHDQDAVAQALTAVQDGPLPTMIACKTIIGYGSPNKQNTSGAHGAPLGEDEIAATRAALGWDYGPFEIPEDVMSAWRAAGGRGGDIRSAWQAAVDGLAAEQRAAFQAMMSGDLPASLDAAIDDHKKNLSAEAPKLATRASSGKALEVINPVVTNTLGGSADLTGSNNTITPDLGILSVNNMTGRYVHYGVREHGMAAVMNGVALHGGFIPYSGTFMVFTDYCRPAIRLSALMQQRVIYVMTHDSIGLGEDGPTHQPVEHLAAMRATPNLNVYRPADAVEAAECWQLGLGTKQTPSIMSLTRQGVPTLRTDHTDENLCARGAYVLREAEGEAQVTLIGSGSEVEIAVAARDMLQADGIGTRVVSMPCWELFEAQSTEYRDSIIAPRTVRIAIEAAGSFGWERYIGSDGVFIGMTGFGASAPAGALYKHFGITADAMVAAAKERL